MWQSKCRKSPRGKAIAAVVRGQQGDTGNSGAKCFICQKQGHTKQECMVEKSKLYCQHCKKRGNHNTNRFCQAFKPENKDKTKKGNNKPGDKKKAKARTVKETEKEEEELEEDDEDEDSDSTPLFVSRIQWWPLEETDSEGELDTSNEPEVFFLDSEFETEDDSSENESGYFTPPNSPAEEGIPLLTEDEDDPLMSEEDLGPPLLSDSEPDSESESEGDSEDDDDDIPVHHYLNNILNPLIVREPATTPAAAEDQNPPGARVWTEPQDDTEAEHQEVTHEMLLHILEINEERNAVRETATVESPPINDPTPVLRPEQVSSTAVEPPAEYNPQDGEVDFDSEDDQALLDCVQLDLEAEDIFNKMGRGAPPVFMTNSMLSYIVNYPLSDKFK